MDKIKTIGQLVLFHVGELSITLSQVLILIVGVFVIFLISRTLKRIIKKSQRINKHGDAFQVILIRASNYIVWVVGLAILLRLEHVKTKTFFNYELFATDKVSITIQKVLILIVVIFLVRFVVLLVDYLMNRKIERDHLDYGKSRSILQILKYSIWTVGLLIGIGALGLKLTFIIASVSALLVGVGFGLQNIFNDFFSGIILLFDGSIKVKDVVQVGDIVGRVKEIGIRTTKVLNRDNIILIIPNSKFTSDNIINWSHMDTKSRFSVSIGVAYGSNVKLVEEILLACAAASDDVVESPKPFVRFEDFGDSSLNFSLYFWTYRSFSVEDIKSSIRFEIDDRFRTNNITIPFPQRDIHIKK